VHRRAREDVSSRERAWPERHPRLPRDVSRLSQRDPHRSRARDVARTRSRRPAAHGSGLSDCRWTGLGVSGLDAVSDSYDIIIIGTGAGGGTVAHALAGTSARILIVERGDFVPQEAENWSAEAVWKDLRYRTRERWLDEEGREFQPYTHYNVGGNTKFWGSVLYRLRREDFQAMEHADGVSPAWP